MRGLVMWVVFVVALVFYTLGLGYVWDAMVDALVGAKEAR